MSETPPPPPGNENMPPPPPPPGDANTPPQPMSYATPFQEFESNPDIRLNGMLCHLLVFSGVIVPFGNIIGPLVMWLVKKDEQPFVKHHGAEAINFNITATIASVVAGATFCIGIGIILLLAVIVVWFVFTIIATIEANKGAYYRYPMCIRLIS